MQSEVLRLDLEVKSPLFIGDGDTLTPLSYIREGNKLHIINMERFLLSLSEEERQDYIQWIEPILERKLASRPSLADFIRERLGKEPTLFIRKLDSISYSLSWEQPPAVDNIHTFIKGADASPFIPGTELKGALRTSLIYTLLKEDYYKNLQPRLKSFGQHLRCGEKSKEFGKLGKEVESILRGKKKDDPKFDLLKFMQLGDAPLPRESLHLYNLESIGTRRFTRMVAEGIREGTKTQVRLVLVQDELSLKNLGLEKLSANLSRDRIINSLYLRSKEILSDAAQYFKDHPRMQTHIRELEKANEPSSPLLRLGRGQGFLSTTVNLVVKQRDEELYEYVREGFSLMRRQRTTPGKFPKTRRVVSDGEGNPLALPGWVKVTF